MTSRDSWRAWPPLIRFSARSSIHFTGRSPRTMDATTTADFLADRKAFCPNDPPTSRMTMWMSFSGTPSSRE